MVSVYKFYVGIRKRIIEGYVFSSELIFSFRFIILSVYIVINEIVMYDVNFD